MGLVELNRDAHPPDLPTSVNNLAVQLREAGQREKPLALAIARTTPTYAGRRQTRADGLTALERTSSKSVWSDLVARCPVAVFDIVRQRIP